MLITITIISIIIKDFSGNLCIQRCGQELRPHHLKTLKAIGFLSKSNPDKLAPEKSHCCQASIQCWAIIGLVAERL